MEFGALEFRHLETEVQIPPLFRSHPTVFTGLLRLANHTEPLDELTFYPFLFQKSLQERVMMHNVPRDVVHFDPQGNTAKVHVHI